MAPQKLTEYERKRLENIKRNEQMISALKIKSTATLLSAAVTKRKSAESKSYKVSPDKKQKTEAPIVIRRSLRTRGIAPDSKGLTDDFVDKPQKSVSPSKPRVLGPLSMRDAFSGDDIAYNGRLVAAILSISKKPQVGVSVKKEFNGVKAGKGGSLGEKCEWSSCKKEVLECPDKLGKSETEIGADLGMSIKEENDGVNAFKYEKLSDKGNLGSCGLVMGTVKSEYKDGSVKIEKSEPRNSLDLYSLMLKPENVARILPGRIMVVKFFPCTDLRMVVAGNKFGNVSFWNVNSKDDDGIYLYRPHTGPISGISIQQSSMSKILTSCYDGFIRLMDVNREVFDLVHSTDETVFSLSQQPNDIMSLYFGEGHGGLNIWDLRAGKSSMKYMLHEDRINTIDFNPQNPNIMATSSTDGTACIWDLRSINASKRKTLKVVNHDRAVHAAYFSPSGSSLATTSFDNKVGILSGINFEDISMIDHDNQTGRWISSFRAIWGWDDSHVFIGNMTRGIDVISPAQRKIIMTLKSTHMSAIPCRFNAHPYEVGTLAGATSGGQVYICTSS
ncbi:hypothetical protein SLE2022_035820 [Rubroshorea leprosula]